MHILLIEDDARVSAHVRRALEQEGHLVDLAETGDAGLIRATSERYDVIVLDRMMPNLDGLTVLHTLRNMKDTTPVLILSALGDIDERVRGLRAGGDDYLSKPFAMSELLARVEVLGRRAVAEAEPAEIRLRDLRIDLLGRSVQRARNRIELTDREFRILVYLARNAGRVVTRAMLLEHVWNYHFDPQTNVIDQHVSRLRQKLDRDSETPLIQTVRGAGYVIRIAP